MQTKLEEARSYEMEHEKEINPQERPAFHLSSRVGWMNDPNGFSFYQGKYHLFYQYHPYSLNWGPMHWGHAVSENLLQWEYLPAALAPDQEYDNFGCFSGSAAELPDGRQLLMYTGVRRMQMEDGSVKDIQTQCMAAGNGLNYEKYDGNPVIDAGQIPDGFSNLDFRDPKLWREADGSYSCAVANRTEDGSGAILLFHSADGFHWSFGSVLDRSSLKYGKMWECPDYFSLNGKQVLLVSPQEMKAQEMEFHNGNCTMAIIGSFDEKSGTLVREKIQAVDYGIDFYATQTIEAPDGRRIMTAWMQNWDTTGHRMHEAKWFSQMIVPRELSLRDGRLIQMPVRELETRRKEKVSHTVQLTDEKMTLPGVDGRKIDLLIKLQPLRNGYDRFRIRVAENEEFYTQIEYDPRTSVLHFDRIHSGCSSDVIHERSCLVRYHHGELKLRLVLDLYSVEMFVNEGEQAMTACIYTPQQAKGISFETVGCAELDVTKYEL